jgi:endonuclease/exonuclease/phosphatase (EEP) superfamily protein YafD
MRFDLTVMTYNVGNGLARPRRLASLLRASGAEVIGLQELDVVQARVLREALADDYPHQVLHPTGFPGKGLLSRFPIRAHDQLALYPERPDLRAVLDVRGRSVTVCVGHPPPPRLRRKGLSFDEQALAQIDALGETVAACGPSLLLADLNLTPRHPSYQRLRQLGLTDAFAAAGRGRGYTLPLRPGRSQRTKLRLGWLPLRPFLRVDYIWHTREMATRTSWLGRDSGSDHLPVLARLTLRSEAAA